jgi:aromatic-L-amino-acid decarboxylase
MFKTNSLDLEDFEKHLNKVAEIACRYTNTISQNPVVPQTTYADLYTLLDEKLPRESTAIEQLFAEIDENVIPNCTKIGHPRFLAWLLTSPSPAGTLGEMLNVALNQIPTMYKSSPAATVIEDIVIKWFGEMFGYTKNFGGILTSGGTTASVIGLTVAREVHFPGAMKTGLQGLKNPPVLYVSDQGHVSIESAAGLLGIGSDFVRRIPTDADFKMNIDALNDQVNKDKAAGFAPFCVVAQVGSTNTGSVDSIQKIVDVCVKNKLWLHIDAAYGGGTILTSAGRTLLAGIEQADSIATDPHKWFFTPAEAGCILIKNKHYLFDTFKSKYGSLEDEIATDHMNYGIQFTRASKAFKIWFAFRAYGLTAIAQIIEQNMFLAQQFKAKLEALNNWQLLAPVELSAVCFRYVPSTKLSHEALDAIQVKIVRHVEKSGEVFFATAVVRGKVAIRACFANHRTTFFLLPHFYLCSPTLRIVTLDETINGMVG